MMTYEELQKAYQALQDENAALKDQLQNFTSWQKEVDFALPEAERKARQELAQKNAILQAIPDHIFIMNSDGVYIDFRGDRGYLHDNITHIGTNVNDSDLPKEVIKKILDHNKRALDSGDVQLIEYSLPSATQDATYYESRSIKYTDNLVMRLVRDITERKRIESRIKLAETYKRVMLKVIPDMILLMNMEGNFMDIRGSYDKASLFAYRVGANVRDANMSQYIIDMWLGDNLAALEDNQMQFSEYKIEINENVYYYESRTVRYTKKQVLKIVRDITDRKNAEEKIRIEEIRKNAILRAIPDMIFVMNEKGNYIDFRGGHGKVFIDPDLIIGSNILDSQMPSDVLKKINDSNQKALETGNIQFMEYSLVINNKMQYYESRAIRYTKNQVLRVVRDITDQKDAEHENAQLVTELQMLNEELISSEEEIRQTLEHTIELKNEIEKSELYYKALINSSPDIIISINAYYCIEFIHLPNRPELDLQSFIGMEIYVIIPDEETKNKAQQALAFVFETGTPTFYETQFIDTRLNELKYYYTYYAPIQSNGKIISVYSVTKDITETKIVENRIKEVSRNLQTTIDNSIQYTLLLDTEGKIMLVGANTVHQTKEQLGLTIIIGSKMTDYIPQETREFFSANFARALLGERVKSERKIKTRDRSVWLDVIYSPVFDEKGKVTAVVVGQMDITARKENEEYLQKVNHELINQNKQLTHYSYVVSHNLRSPVATILGLVGLFKLEESANTASEELLEMLEESTYKLDTVVRDLNFILSETQLVQEDKQDIDFEKAFLGIIDSLKLQIKQCDAQIYHDFSSAKTIFASKTFIHNVLLNLLTNAIKFRRRNISPRISIQTIVIGDYTCLIITDNGLGIDIVAQKENLFKLYKRFHPQIEGKGINLYILKTQVEMQGGKVEIESEENKGTTFKIYLNNQNK